MERNEILKGNELISIFMNEEMTVNSKKELRVKHNSQNLFLPVECLRYVDSWDWLMPVVEKIESYNHTWKGYDKFYVDGFHIGEDFAFTVKVRITEFKPKVRAFMLCQFSYLIEYSLMKKANSKIEAVYLAVVEFIKYYNNKIIKSSKR